MAALFIFLDCLLAAMAALFTFFECLLAACSSFVYFNPGMRILAAVAALFTSSLDYLLTALAALLL